MEKKYWGLDVATAVVGTTARPREVIMMANNVRPHDLEKNELFSFKLDCSGYRMTSCVEAVWQTQEVLVRRGQ